MSASSSSAVSADPISVAVRSIHAMADGDRAEFDSLYHPQAVDRENQIQPPSSRVPGPACFYSTALWLRAAFADLHYDIHHAVADGTLVAVNSTMNGRHVAPWAVYTEDGTVDTVFPPTNKTFATTQSHWFRVEDGRITEHWANRDDLGTAKQLGWVPPTPAYLFKMARAKRRAIRPDLGDDLAELAQSRLPAESSLNSPCARVRDRSSSSVRSLGLLEAG